MAAAPKSVTVSLTDYQEDIARLCQALTHRLFRSPWI